MLGYKLQNPHLNLFEYLWLSWASSHLLTSLQQKWVWLTKTVVPKRGLTHLNFPMFLMAGAVPVSIFLTHCPIH